MSPGGGKRLRPLLVLAAAELGAADEAALAQAVAAVAGPYGGVRIDILQSALGIPCNTPPFGNDERHRSQYSSADVANSDGLRREHTGPLGLKPICISRVPTLGGPTSDRSADLLPGPRITTCGRWIPQPVKSCKARASAGRRSGRAADRQIAENGQGVCGDLCRRRQPLPDVGDDIIAYALEE